MIAELLIILGLIALNGVFSGAEIALISLRRSRLRELAKEGSSRARAALALREVPDRLLATVQVGITAVGATAAAFGGSRFAADLAPLFRDLGLGSYADETALAVVIVGITYLSVVLGELVPKSLALHAAEGYALAVARPLLGLAGLMRPLVWLLNASANLVLRLFHDRTTFAEARHSPAELQQFAEAAAAMGTLHPRTADIASRAIDFGEITVGAVMVPRRLIASIPNEASPEAIIAAVRASNHARYPVCEGDLDHVIGYVAAREILSALAAGEPMRVADHARAVQFVPESTLAVVALQELLSRRSHLALVVDELGGIVGLLTIEDLLEELVGEIASEQDELPSDIRPEPDGSFLIQGTTAVHQVNRALDIELPGEEADTLGGLVVAERGWMPQPGDRFQFGGGIVIEVVEVTPRRVKIVRVHRPPNPPATPLAD